MIRSADWRISSRNFFASSRIQERPCGLDGLKKILIVNRAGHDQIDRPAKESRQRFSQTKIGVSVFAIGEWLEFDQEVDVTEVVVERAGSGRAEYFEPLDAVTTTEF